MAVYQGNMFPQLKGDLLITALKKKRLYWVRMLANQVVFAEPVVDALQQRLRDIQIGSDGAIYILTDGVNASLLRMAAVN